MKATFEARVADEAAYPVLDAMADLLGRAERALWAAAAARSCRSATLKAEWLRRFGLTARHFNSLAIDLEARMAAAKAAQRRHTATLGTMIENLKVRIARGTRRLAALRLRERARIHDEGTRRQKMARRLHSLKRRLASLENRRTRVQADAVAGRVHLCFGGRRLFRHQFALKESGFRSHAEWRHL